MPRYSEDDVAARPIYHYQYWSPRLTSELANDVRISLRPTWLWKLSAAFHGAGVEAQQQERSLRLDEVAAKLEASGVVHEFTGSEEFRSIPFFVRGVGHVTLMRSWVGEKEGHSSVIYGTVQTHGVGKLVLCGRVSQRMHECLI